MGVECLFQATVEAEQGGGQRVKDIRCLITVPEQGGVPTRACGKVSNRLG